MHHPERDGIRLPLVPYDQLSERLGVAPAGVFDELSFVRLQARLRSLSSR
jgi:hypothetical protein